MELNEKQTKICFLWEYTKKIQIFGELILALNGLEDLHKKCM